MSRFSQVEGQLTVGVLGPLAVWAGDSEVELSSAAQRLILLLLVAGGGSRVSVDSLIDAVWGEAVPAHPENSLRYHVWKLRGAIGDVVRTEDRGYSIDLERVTVDADTFLDRIDRGLSSPSPDSRIALLDEALATWRGEPYAEAAGEMTIIPIVRKLVESHDLAVEGRATTLVEVGREALAIPELEALLARDPYREASWGALMLAYYRLGRQRDALNAFSRARAVLGEDLGLEPWPELGELESRILLQDAGLNAPAREMTNLPVPISSFVGREAERRRLEDLVAQRRLVTITGPAGAGKSRLTVESARGMVARFPDGVWFVDLTRLMTGTDISGSIGRAIGLSRSDTEIPDRTEVHLFLRHRNALIILDNCEHVLEDVAEVVEDLLRDCGGIRIVATSRTPLRVGGEAVLRLPILPIPEQVDDPDRWLEVPSAKLLVERARDAGADIELNEGSLRSLTSICELAAGIPLAIELAAGRLATTGVADLVDDLSMHLGALGERRGSVDRHRTMTSLIEWSYGLLSKSEQRFFRWLGVFVGGFEAVAGARMTGHDEGEFRRALSELEDQSMVVRDPSSPARYVILEPFRLFCLEELDANGEREAAAHAHSSAMVDVSVSLFERHRGADRLELLERMRRDSGNLRLALEHLQASRRHGELCRLVAALRWVWEADNRIDDERHWATLCLPHIDLVDAETAGAVHLVLAHAAEASGRRGGSHLVRALECVERSGDDLFRADALMMRVRFGDDFGVAGRISTAEAAHEAADIYRAHGDNWGLVRALSASAEAMAWSGLGPDDDRIGLARESQRLARSIGFADGLITALGSEFMAIHHRVERTAESPEQDRLRVSEIFDEARSVAAEQEDPRLVVSVDHAVAWYHWDIGDPQRALEAFAETAPLSAEYGMLLEAVAGNGAICLISLDEGDVERARAAITVALDLALERNVDAQTVWIIELAAFVLLEAGESREAARLIGAAERIREDRPIPMPSWDRERYAAARRQILGAVGDDFQSLVEEGEERTASQAATEAREAILALG